MFELTVDALDPGIARFQLYLAVLITLLAILFTAIRAFLAERDADRRRKVLSEMKEYKEKVRKEEAHKHQADLKKWEEGEDWPVKPKDDEGPAEPKDKGPKQKTPEGGGPDGEEEK